MIDRQSLLAQLLMGPPQPATRLSQLAGAPPADPVDAMRASLPPMATPDTRAGRPNRLAELTMPSPMQEDRQSTLARLLNTPGIEAALTMTPVVGDVASLGYAARDALRGDWWGAGLNALGVLPLVPGMAGMVRRADKGADVAEGVARAAADWNPHNAAREAKEQLERLGFRVRLETSETKVGRSAYLRVFDDEAGRYTVEDIRFSDHSLGPSRSQYTVSVRGPEDVSAVFDYAQRLRDVPQGTPIAARAAQEADQAAARAAAQAAEEARAQQLSEAAQRLFPDEWARWAGKSGPAAKKEMRLLRRRAEEAGF